METLPLFAQDDNTPQKRCTTCGNAFPATTEYFHRAPTGKHGLHPKCKQCRSTKRPSPFEKAPDGYKRCTQCHEIFAETLEFFPPSKETKNGLKSGCRKCKNDHFKKRRENPELRDAILAEKRAYHARADIRERRRINDSTPEAREHRRAYRRQPHVSQYERVYAKSYHSRPEIQERYRLYSQAYNQRPDVKERVHFYHSQPHVKVMYKTYAHKRRAAKLNAEGTHTPEQIKEQYERQRGKCYYCHQKVKWSNHHVDHVVPLSRGGSNDISNLVIACAHCNTSKNNKLPHEWSRGGRLL